MNAAQRIRRAVGEVSHLRQLRDREPGLPGAMLEVKRTQGRRFAGTYADLLASGPYSGAARFFLEELYSDKDFAERDAQFGRIAGAMERLFPADVSETAVSLAQLHALTEDLDHAMALEWVQPSRQMLARAANYTLSWRAVGRRSDREAQLRVVLGIGTEMARLTRLPGLRLMLKMMRGPAAAAGLSSLQRFLESGFDTFAQVARRRGGVDSFLSTIEMRESALISMLFDADAVACETQLAKLLGEAP